MHITATVSTVPVLVHLDLPDDTPVGEVRDKIIEQARVILANNGSEHVVLSASVPELVDNLGRLSRIGFPVEVEYVEIEPEADWNDLAEFGVSRTYERDLLND